MKKIEHASPPPFKPRIRPFLGLLIALFAGLSLARTAAAAIPFQAGNYQGQIWTDPAVIPVAKAQVYVSLKAGDQPVTGATVRVIARMPGMPMGEKETVAEAVPEQPGTYVTDASFPMAGGYEIALQVSGPNGAAAAKLPVSTGQDTGGPTGAAGGSRLFPILFAAGAVVLIVFVLYRMRKTGQRIEPRAVLNRQVIGGLLLMGLMLAVAAYAVNNYRRKGAMTPIEAQAMEMSTPAPPGTSAVELATVRRGDMQSTVTYTGSAVPYVEVNVYPRVSGWITWMPSYAGDRVKAGQLLARLDTSQVEPQVAERRAGVSMAEQGVTVATSEYRQALTEVSQARAELAGRRGAVEEARANLEAAREERANTEAEAAAAEAQVRDARAQLTSAQADREYWRQAIRRTEALVREGAVSREEYQREQAQAETAAAKVRQAQAGINQALAQVRAAQSRVRKADAMIAAARTKVQQTTSDLMAHHAHVRSTQAAADAAQRRIGQSRAGVEQARASLGGATTARGYTEIRSQVDGVVTERLISPGVLVNPGQAILQVAQIRPIRLQANVAEGDLARIEAGSRVVVRDRNGAGPPVVTKVTSVTPAVDPVARTGIVEALHPNRDGRFLPGEFLTMAITTGAKADTLWVPARAVQTRTLPSGRTTSTETSAYVWVAEPGAGTEGEFTARPVDVKTGLSDGERTEILSGLREGQQVVTAGYEYLKEGGTVVPEGTRVAKTGGGMPSMPGMPGMKGGESSEGMKGTSGKSGEKGDAPGGAPPATVAVTEQGFQPGSLTLESGVPARITFVRKTDATCATEVVFPEYHIKEALPLNRPVVVEFTPKKAGEVTFTCGMNMLRGKAVVR